MCVVYFDDHLHQLAWAKSILSERHGGDCETLTDTATTSDCSLGTPLLSLHYSCLPQHYLSAASDTELASLGLDGCSHVIDDDTFLFGSVVAETCRPSFKGLEAKRKAVLSWWEPTAVVDHCLVSCKHVPCLIISHLIVSVAGCPNVLWPEVPLIVLLRFTIGYVKILY